MTPRPRTIQIYLPSGDPRGIRVAALTTSIVQVVEIPRALLGQFQEMPESKQVGVYFLVGDDEEKDQLSVYIGQTGALGKRLNEHHLDARKEFWNRALVAVSLTHSLTQTHALFLEWRGIQQANDAARYLVENGNGGTKPHTPPWLEADCQDIFDTMRTLVATLGQPVFEPLALAKEQTTPDDVFYCRSAACEAIGQYTEEGMVVLKGSKARIDVAPSMANLSPAKRRQALIKEGTLKLDGNAYVFQQDVLFKSPSGASDLVTGTSTNGWIQWKTKAGKTLDELKRQV
jgi:predicted GIY-YIG superfamily endonuclease